MKNHKSIFGICLLATFSIISSYSQESKQEIATVQIGSQNWSVKNLDVSTYRNGDNIPEVEDLKEWKKLTTGAWCYYQDTAATFFTPKYKQVAGKPGEWINLPIIDVARRYGKLYNWYAVNDPRGLAPSGFHIPSDQEWKILADYLGGYNGAGRKMKSKIDWRDKIDWKEKGNGTNESGFNGLPGGYLLSFRGGSFVGLSESGWWWGSTDRSTKCAWSYLMSSNYSSFDRFDGNYKRNGLSVRCIKD